MRAPSSVRVIAAAWLVALLVLLWPIARARADSASEASAASAATTRAGQRARALALAELAEREDADLDLERALLHYEEARALDPHGARATRAGARAEALRARAEGSLRPLQRLERVRRDPSLADSPEAVERLVRDAEAFPPGLVRVEVWMLAAEAFDRRFGRPKEAEALLRRVLVDPHADAVVSQKAARDLVTVALDRGDLAAASAAVRLAGERADPRLASDVRRASRRQTVHRAAIATLSLIALLAARALRRRDARAAVSRALGRTWRLAVGYAAYVAVGGALLASGYARSTALPFVAFGAALVPLVLVARAWGAGGGQSAAARSGRALACALGAFGAAFLVLEAVNAAFLDGVGL